MAQGEINWGKDLIDSYSTAYKVVAGSLKPENMFRL